MSFGYHFPHPSSLAGLGPCFGAREYHNTRVWVQAAWPDFQCIGQVWLSLEVPDPSLMDWDTFRGWAGEASLVLAHLCSPAQGLCSAPQWDAGFHQSFLPPTQRGWEQRNSSVIWNSRISFYCTAQSILTCFRQGECCRFTANALCRKCTYIKPLLWPCLTFTLQINGSR